jgi:hypothetical protein
MNARLQNKPGPLPAGTVSDSALALMGLSVCEAAGPLHSLSLALLLFTFIMGMVGFGLNAMLLLMVGCVLAGCQTWFAWRLAFDKQVFAAWARLDDDGCMEAQRAFDAALGTLLKKSVPADGSRSMFGRVMGVRRLHLLQAAVLLGQILMFFVLMIYLLWGFNHV